MKATSLGGLRRSVREATWSNTEGANKVLQKEWEKKAAGKKDLGGSILSTPCLGSETGAFGRHPRHHAPR